MRIMDPKKENRGTCVACWATDQVLKYDRISGNYKCPKCRAVDKRIEAQIRAGY